MKIAVKNMVWVMIILCLIMNSCSKEGIDGAIGPEGPQGEQGITGDSGSIGAAGPQGVQGEPGVDGTNGSIGPQGEQGVSGTPGEDGANGTNGTNGADGNANVSVYKYDLPANFLDVFYARTIPQFTTQVLADELILSYVVTSDNFVVPLPGRVDGGVYDIYPLYKTSTFIMHFFESGTSNRRTLPANIIKKLKIVIIKASSVKGKSGKSSVLNELKTNSIDISDYYAICDFYGITY